MPVAPYIALGLSICEKMEIFDKKGQGMIMRFAKLYEPEKLGTILEMAQSYSWWQSNPVAGFMKAVGEVNRMEKEVKL